MEAAQGLRSRLAAVDIRYNRSTSTEWNTGIVEVNPCGSVPPDRAEGVTCCAEGCELVRDFQTQRTELPEQNAKGGYE